MNGNFVSIIIPAYNSVRTMKKCVESVLALNYAAYEAIIVDDGSTDGTPAVLGKYKDNPKLRIIRVPNGGPSKARNMAIKEARGEFIAFTDSDCIVDREWLNNLMQGFAADGPVVAVGGGQLSPDDETAFGRDLNDFMKKTGVVADYMKDTPAGAGILETDHNPSCNVMYKKEVLQKVGFFTEDLWPGEDVELDYKIRKLGYRLMFNPAAIVFHYRPADIKSFSKMMFRYGKVQAILVRRYGFFRKIQFAPFLLLFFLLMFLVAALYSIPAVFLMIVLQAGVFLLYFFERNKNIVLSLKHTFLLGMTVIAWNSGFVWGVFRKKCI
jgi:GT2 family glycosyltransferase